MAENVSRVSLREEAAFQLANVTKTAPQFGAITPRWLVRLLDWKPLDAGTFRVNKVNESKVTYIATQDRSIAPDVRSSASSLPSVPGGGVTPTAAPEFGFLQDARPLFQEPVAEPVPQHTLAQASGKPAPSYDGYAAIPFSLLADSQPSQLTQPPAPAIPGALGVVDSSAVPTFSFMEDARPLFSEQPSLPGPVPAGLPSHPFAAPLDLNTPQIAGAVAHEPDFRAPASYDPQYQPRQLDPSNVVPVLVPGAGQSELLGDLGLSSYSFDVEAIRRDFPILQEQVNGHPLIWLDNGATTQKPQSVIDRLTYFYEHENSNVHRAAHELAARSTDAYESAREKTRRSRSTRGRFRKGTIKKHVKLGARA